MIQSLVVLGLAMSIVLVQEHAQKPAKPDVAQMTLKGCLRSAPADPTNVDDKRIVYTLEVAEPGAGVAGTTGRTDEEQKKKIQLSSADAKMLAKLVGHEIQVSGELLQPPGLAPGAAQKMPLPGDAEGTFRVSSVKQLAAKCR